MTNQPVFPWLKCRPDRPGKYLWRSADGSPDGDHEYFVEVFSDWGIGGEVSLAWRCYDVTDFTAMSAGGAWRFVRENRVGSLVASYVANLTNTAATWSTAAPTDNGRYLWRADETQPPVLIQLREGVAGSTGNKERFVTSYAHHLSEEFEALFRAGQWAPVQCSQPW